MRLKLREVRERKFLSQQELADAAGTTKANISRLETGKQKPQMATVRKLAEALGVRPEDLVDWEADAPDAPETGKAAA
jgi:transcriptional regulator with XRE-family HTH domain